MLLRFACALACCLTLLVGPVGRTAPAAAIDHVVIKFKPQVRAQWGGNTRAQHLSQLLARLNLPGADLAEPAVNRLLPSDPNDLDLERFFYLNLPPGMSVDECLGRVRGHPWIAYAEADGVATGGLLPNDPTFPSQWHHRNVTKPSAAIQTPLAWDLTQGSTNIVLAVLDSGLTPSSEFNGRLLAGYNFVSSTTNTLDDFGHGTAVAATAAATGQNGSLVAGVDWRCRILPVKVLDSANNGLYSWFAQGVDYAVSQGARVINLSAGGSGTSTALTESINHAIARGVIFVTITHNDGAGVIRYPGNLPECITVGATDPLDRRAGFSNYGPQIDLCAPGTNIYTVGSSGGVQVWWGTSFSAPQVAGVCGLLLSLVWDINQEDARLLLCAGADDLIGDVTDTPGFDEYYGWGRLNAYNSLLLARTRVDQVSLGSNVVTLSWASPPNASNKQPYQVQLRNSWTEPWITATNANPFRYTSNRTFWTDTNVTTQVRCYRVRLRPLP